MQIALGEGRKVEVAEFGTPEGRPVFYCHGFPASRLDAKLADEAAREVGVRLIALDRPGYGGSDFQPGRRMRDWPADVAAAADALGVQRFAVLADPRVYEILAASLREAFRQVGEAQLTSSCFMRTNGISSRAISGRHAISGMASRTRPCPCPSAALLLRR